MIFSTLKFHCVFLIFSVYVVSLFYIDVLNSSGSLHVIWFSFFLRFTACSCSFSFPLFHLVVLKFSFLLIHFTAMYYYLILVHSLCLSYFFCLASFSYFDVFEKMMHSLWLYYICMPCFTINQRFVYLYWFTPLFSIAYRNLGH